MKKIRRNRIEKIREHGEWENPSEWKNLKEWKSQRVLVMGESKLFDTFKSMFHNGMVFPRWIENSIIHTLFKNEGFHPVIFVRRGFTCMYILHDVFFLYSLSITMKTIYYLDTWPGGVGKLNFLKINVSLDVVKLESCGRVGIYFRFSVQDWEDPGGSDNSL